jgi:hypothetical protein
MLSLGLKPLSLKTSMLAVENCKLGYNELEKLSKIYLRIVLFPSKEQKGTV